MGGCDGTRSAPTLPGGALNALAQLLIAERDLQGTSATGESPDSANSAVERWTQALGRIVFEWGAVAIQDDEFFVPEIAGARTGGDRIISPSNISRAVMSLRRDISQYPEGSAERTILKSIAKESTRIFFVHSNAYQAD